MSQKSEQRFRAFAAWLLGGVAKVLFGARRHVYEKPDKGALILCNHTSVWDFVFACYALRPVSNVHFVITGIEFEKSKLKKWLFDHLGMIRKTQGAVDVMCVKEIIKAVRAGDNVALYAAGMTSFDGRGGWSAMSGTGNLARLLKCPVYTVITEGGFISCPRYSSHLFPGHVDVTVRRICTGENMTADDYQKEIDESLAFNDWNWQEKNNVRFHRYKDMTGITRTLYMCPSCKALGHMSEGKGIIKCEKCGFTAKRDRYGFFHSEDKACPKRMDEWVDAEIAEVRALVENGKLDFAESAAYVSGDIHEKGTVRFDMSGITFESPEGTRHWRANEFLFMIFNDRNFLTFYAGNEQHRFIFDNSALMYRWFFAHRCIVNPGYLQR